MNSAATALVVLVAFLHVYFMILEMFLWTKPKGRKVFGLTEDFANASAGLAKNQGLYNGFLAAGLVWGLLSSTDPAHATAIKLFFLSCIVIAGVYGAATVNRKILIVQALPAAVALALVVLF